jgi:hypothetical protein
MRPQIAQSEGLPKVEMETFIVRIWGPPSPSEEAAVLRGVAEHLSSGHKTTFVNETELLSFLRELEREPTAARQVGGAPWGDEGP